MHFSSLYKLNAFSHDKKFGPSALYPHVSFFSSYPPPLTIEIKVVYRGPDKHGGYEEIPTKMSQKRDKLPSMIR